MGVGVSSWALAKAVSMEGQLGVVSGTGLDIVLARRLQVGDPEGHFRRAMAAFPLREAAARVLKTYFVEGGKKEGTPFRLTPTHSVRPGPALMELTVLGNFVEVFLAKEGHGGVVGINLLEKIQLPTLPALYGAMLAGVDYVLMGAGVPMAIPGALDAMSEGRLASLRLDVEDAEAGQGFVNEFDPRSMWGGSEAPKLKRPQFLGIVSSAVLALALARKASGRVDGFVVEGDTAGGHNAPPRGPQKLNERGEPIYGPRDVPELEKFRALGLPFWLAGSFGKPGRLGEALKEGAAGVQVGTAFAFCEESGIEPSIKRMAIQQSIEGTSDVLTDPVASPTGFPFKVLQVKGTVSEGKVYAERKRICDLGYLRHIYRKADGTPGYRCPSEPVDDYLRKGGKLADTEGRKCVCNGLVGTIGLGQSLPGGGFEPALVTAGDDVAGVVRYLKPGCLTYRAADVIRFILEGVAAPGGPV